MKSGKIIVLLVGLLTFLLLLGCGKDEPTPTTNAVPGSKVKATAVELTDAQIENIVRRSYQFVAMYNVNNKFALDSTTPGNTGGWNKMEANTQLLDHTVKAIARPNNDTLYITMMLDLRKDPVIIDIPPFDSKYVSLMVTGYDHYVNVPMSVTNGDFKKPEKVLFYTARTEKYDGSPVEGIDRTFEMTGDFVSAVFRIMPHANEKARFEKITGQMQSVKLMTLSELHGKPAKAINDVTFPDFGKSDLDVYENNFLEVMQFVANHTTFEPNDELDQALLAALKPLGVEPGKKFDKNKVASIDAERFRSIAEQVQKSEFARAMDQAVTAVHGLSLFKTKGQMPLHLLLLQSVVGPIGLPATEAVYPPVSTMDGQPMNAQNDYVIRMSRDELPPARAFWSLTLYDSANGFFIPNDLKKYSIGENAGMKLDAEGGIDIYVAAEKPEGVSEKNWLPISRKNENMDIILRIYEPDLEKFKLWKTPQAEIVK
jgi:hypothetical protein